MLEGRTLKHRPVIGEGTWQLSRAGEEGGFVGGPVFFATEVAGDGRAIAGEDAGEGARWIMDVLV